MEAGCRARGEKLAELDEGRPHTLEIVGQLRRGRIDRRHRRAFPVQRGIEAGDIHQVAPPVLDEEQSDVLVALEMLRPQRESHEVDRARRPGSGQTGAACYCSRRSSWHASSLHSNA